VIGKKGILGVGAVAVAGILTAITISNNTARDHTQQIMTRLTSSPQNTQVQPTPTFLDRSEGRLASPTLTISPILQAEIPIILESSLERENIASFSEFYRDYKDIFWEKVALEYFRLIRAYYTSNSYIIEIRVFTSQTSLRGFLALSITTLNQIDYYLLAGDILIEVLDQDLGDGNDYNLFTGTGIAAGTEIHRFTTDTNQYEENNIVNIPSGEVIFEDFGSRRLISEDETSGLIEDHSGTDARRIFEDIVRNNHNLSQENTTGLNLPPIADVNGLYEFLMNEMNNNGEKYLVPEGEPLESLKNWLEDHNPHIASTANAES